MRHIPPSAVLFSLFLVATACSDDQAITDADATSQDGDRQRDGGQRSDGATTDAVDAGTEDVAADRPIETAPDDGSTEEIVESDAPDTVDATDADETECYTPADLPTVSLVEDGRYRYIESLEFPNLLPRDIRVYLPADYDGDSAERYPVLYMHDGQNLYRDEDSSYGEWTVDETLDALTVSGVVSPTIVVGVDNTAERMTDYSPDFDPGYGMGGKGDDYADFLVELVKPLIDSHFATRCNRANTHIAGSSMGGLISLHTYMRHPDVFGGVAALSPSLWWHDGVAMEHFEAFDGRLPRRLWIDGGSLEGASPGSGVVPALTTNIRRVRDVALERGMMLGESLGFLEDPGAAHNEYAWANRLDSILWFLLSDQRPADLGIDRVSLFSYAETLQLGSVPSRTTVAFEARHGGWVRLTWPNSAVSFESLATSVLAIDAQGTVSAVAEGSGEIKATFQGQSAQTEITVETPSVGDITFSVVVPGDTPPGDTIYVAGSIPELGEWLPNGQPLTLVGDRWEATVAIPLDSTFEFKITRGIWETVEKYADGSERPNRRWSVVEDATIDITVESWADR